MSWSVAVVCEAPADRDTAAALVTRVACEALDWMEPEYLAYRGFRPTDPQLLWREVKPLAGANGVTVAGFMRGAPASPDAHAATRALLLFARCTEQVGKVDAVLLVRDSDTDLTRRDGLAQARASEPWPFPVVVGLAHTKRECWHLAGFDPLDGAEKNRLDELRRELGFNPCEKSEELTARSGATADKRSAKRVLATLTGDDGDRERACLAQLPLAELTRRGRYNGLAEFIAEIELRLLPLFGHHLPPTG